MAIALADAQRTSCRRVLSCPARRLRQDRDSLRVGGHVGYLLPGRQRNAARVNDTAMLLPNGQVLVAGSGFGPVTLTSAELYSPAAGRWVAARRGRAGDRGRLARPPVQRAVPTGDRSVAGPHRRAR